MRALMLCGLLGLTPSLPPEYSREWCATEAATDGQLEACADLYPDLWPEECLCQYPDDDAGDEVCEPVCEGEEPEDVDSIYCEEE